MAGFEGKNFYFDLENSPQIKRQLTQFITQLGGEIKGFLDQRVKYIITSRPKDQWPPKNPTAGPADRFRPVDEHTVQSPINLNKNSSFSRGSLLLSKIRANTLSTANDGPNRPPALPTDVLERGRYWNIQILNALDVLDFCKRHLSPKVVNDLAVQSAQIRRLKGPHVKIEDNRLQHRPIYKEFYEWPTINYEFQEFLCPFLKKKVQKDVNHKVAEPRESLEGLAVKGFGNNGSRTPTVTTNGDNNDINNDKNGTKSVDKSPPRDVTLIRKSLIKRRRTPAYCEICGTEYDDLQEHLKSAEHESYTKNEDNYRELKGVIQSLAPFMDTSVSKCVNFDSGSDCSDSEGDTEAVGSGGDREDDDNSSSGTDSSSDHPLSPFQSTPNMSTTTIQLCGSKHKSHFLPIHDLVGGHRSPHSPLGDPEESDDQRQHNTCNGNNNNHPNRRSAKTFEASDQLLDEVIIPPSVTTPTTTKQWPQKVTLNSCHTSSDSTIISRKTNVCLSSEEL